MERKLLLSRIKTPDGTVLISRHRHDFVCYTDANGKEYCLDGGYDYQRVIADDDWEDASIYSDSDFELIRSNIYRGTYGINGTEPYKEVLVKDIDDSWLVAIIKYEKEYRPNNPFIEVFLKEAHYRKLTN